MRSQSVQAEPQTVVYEKTYDPGPGTTVTRKWSLLRPFTIETRRTRHESNDGGNRTIGQRGSITIRRGNNDRASSLRDDSHRPKRDNPRPARVERKSRNRGR